MNKCNYDLDNDIWTQHSKMSWPITTRARMLTSRLFGKLVWSSGLIQLLCRTHRIHGWTAMWYDLRDPHFEEIARTIPREPVRPRILGICQGDQMGQRSSGPVCQIKCEWHDCSKICNSYTWSYTYGIQNNTSSMKACSCMNNLKQGNQILIHSLNSIKSFNFLFCSRDKSIDLGKKSNLIGKKPWGLKSFIRYSLQMLAEGRNNSVDGRFEGCMNSLAVGIAGPHVRIQADLWVITVRLEHGGLQRGRGGESQLQVLLKRLSTETRIHAHKWIYKICFIICHLS